MIDKPLSEIDYSDIDKALEEKLPEGQTLDYKRDIYGNGNDDKKELLKDVSSFANTHGGDLIIGVDEVGGLPTAIPGVVVADLEQEKLRLEQIIRTGIEPRIDCTVHPVQNSTGNTVILIRVLESIIPPHRVV